jgi:hypothetical protein
MRPITVSVGNLAVAGNAVLVRTALVAPAGALVLDGATSMGAGVDRNILFTFAAAEPGLRLELSGRNVAGNTVSETIYGPAAPGTVMSVNQYNKVTGVNGNQASLGAVSIGTASVGASPMVALDPWAWTPIGVMVKVGGTVAYDIEVTADDPNSPTNPVAINDMVWIDAPDAALVGKTANASGQLVVPWAYARIFLNSGTGLVTATFTQPGVVNL